MLTEIIDITVSGQQVKVTYVVRRKKKMYQTSIPIKILSELNQIIGEEKRQVLNSYINRTHKEYYEIEITNSDINLTDEELIKKKLDWIK
jgi:hypothetical protein